MRSLARPSFVSVAVIAAGAMLSCSSGTEPRAPGRPASLQIVSGNQQQGTVGEELSQALVVQLLDDDGQPVPGQLVNWVVTAGGGSVYAGAALTNSQGIAQERWTLGTSTMVENVLEVRAVDSETGAPLLFGRFTAQGIAGPAASLEKVVEVPAASPARQPTVPSPVVRALDQYGNAAPDVEVTFEVTSGGGSVSPAVVVTNAEGQATTTWTLGPTIGTQTLRASAGSAEPVEFSTVATADQTLEGLAIARQPSSTAASYEPFPVQPIVQLVNGFGDPVHLADVQVSVGLAAGNGLLEGTRTVKTDADGKATFTDLYIRSYGQTFVLVFSAPGLEPVHSEPITVPAWNYTLEKHSGDGQTAAPGSTIEVQVRLMDNETGQPVAGQRAHTWAKSGGGGTTPQSAVTNAEGIATFQWRLGSQLGPNELQVWVNDVVPVIFTATAENVQKLTLIEVSGDATGRRLNTQHTVRVRTAPNITVNYEVLAGGGTLTSSTSVTDAFGNTAFDGWILGPEPGENVLLAYVPGDSVTFHVTTIPNVVLTVEQPAVDGTVQGTATIVAHVNAAHPMGAVRATIATKSVDLAYQSSTDRWTGAILMTDDVPRGEHELIVVATDADGESAEVRRRIHHDYPPTISVTRPVDNEVVNGVVRVQASCTDQEGPCWIRVGEEVSHALLISDVQGSVDQEINVSSMVGRTLRLKIVATDALGQSVDVIRRVQVVAP